jgi:hypothetical protein
MKALNFLLATLLFVTLTSCQRESVTPSNIPPNNTTIVGQWFNDPLNVYSQGDTTQISVNGNQYMVTELDYVIYQPVAMTYDAATNQITVSGTQGQYTVTGTGYLIGNDTLHLDYIVTPGMTNEMHSNWYRQ